MTRLEWLQARQGGISASDAPSLLGVGFKDALSVYRSKTEPVSDRVPETGVLARGIALESIVAKRYSEVMGTEVFAPGFELVRHNARPWQTCSPDLFAVPIARPVQLKTCTGFSDDWGPSGTDQIPDGYMVQVQQELGVMEAESGDLCALDVLAWECRVYRIAFDPEFFAWLTEIEERFLTDHLTPRVAPGPEWELQFKEEAQSRICKGTTVDLGPEIAALIDQRREFGDIKKEAEAEYDRLTARIMAVMGSAEIATAGGWKVKRIEVAGGKEISYTSKPYSRLDIRRSKEK